MNRLVCDRAAEVAAWVAARCGVAEFGPCAAIGVEREGRLVAGAVFHEHDHGSMLVSFAADDLRWAQRGVLAGIFAYPFRQVRCRRLTAVTDVANARAIRLLGKLGFRPEGRLREHFVNSAGAASDGAIFGMLARECRWLPAEGGA